MALTDSKLKSIHGKTYTGVPELTDGEGLSARISQKGTIAFQFRYRWAGKAQRLTIGRYPAMSLREARVLVGEMRLMYDKGLDPRNYGNGNAQSVTLQQCLDYWMENYVQAQLRSFTQQLYKSVVYKNLIDKFEGIPVEQISARQWVDFLNNEEKINPKRARVILVQAKSAINWCIGRHYIASSELMKVHPKNIGIKSDIGQRDLSYKELAKIWLVIERSRASTSNKFLHQMLMLWGGRVSELRLATRADFNMDERVWVVPAEKSKTGNVIKRPIFEQMKPFVERLLMTFDDVMFPARSLDKPMSVHAANRYIGRIRDTVALQYWSSHDFRRSLVTRLSEEGVMPHVTEKMLGHELGGIMAVYNKHDWLEDQRQAYELYADKIFWHVKNAG